MPITPIHFPICQNTFPIINTKSYLDHPENEYRRLKGFRKVERNDIVVFNFPAGDTIAYNVQNPDYYTSCYIEGFKQQNPTSLHEYYSYEFGKRCIELGRRVVIPKEIRKTLRIKEGTPLEIFTDREGEIILKKYSPIGELNVFAKEYAEALAQSSGMVACITDHDQVVAAAGQGSREYVGKPISKAHARRAGKHEEHHGL